MSRKRTRQVTSAEKVVAPVASTVQLDEDDQGRQAKRPKTDPTVPTPGRVISYVRWLEDHSKDGSLGEPETVVISSRPSSTPTLTLPQYAPGYFDLLEPLDLRLPEELVERWKTREKGLVQKRKVQLRTYTNNGKSHFQGVDISLMSSEGLSELFLPVAEQDEKLVCTYIHCQSAKKLNRKLYIKGHLVCQADWQYWNNHDRAFLRSPELCARGRLVTKVKGEATIICGNDNCKKEISVEKSRVIKPEPGSVIRVCEACGTWWRRNGHEPRPKHICHPENPSKRPYTHRQRRKPPKGNTKNHDTK